MSTIITRVGWCDICANSRNPRTGQKFLAYGSTHHSYHVLEAERNGQIGFVPHIYKLEKKIGDNLVIFRCCGMYGCGVERKWEKSGYWFYYPKEWKREIWTVAQWEALVYLKNNLFTKQYTI